MTDSSTSDGSTAMRVGQIFVYPVKSLRGLNPPSHTATYTGFQHDRRFMLQRVSNGANMAVAKETEMCLFTTHVPSPSSHTDPNNNGSGPDSSSIEVRYTLPHAFKTPSQPVSPTPLLIPLNPSTHDLPQVRITMHHSPTQAYDMGATYNDWFSERFGYAVRLLYIGGNTRLVLGNMPPNIAGLQREKGTRGEGVGNDYERIVGEQQNRTESAAGGGWLGGISGVVKNVLPWAGEDKKNQQQPAPQGETNSYDGVDKGIAFADVAPFLVISRKSWEDAQRRVSSSDASDSSSSSLDITKFRPNIVIDTPDSVDAYDEDFWAELEIIHPQMNTRKAVIVLTQNCARCNSLNVDYSTGKVGEGESGTILKKLMGDRRVDAGAKWSPVFGRYGFLKRVDGDTEGESVREGGGGGVTVSVGDEVRVIKRNKERTRFEWPNLSTNS